MWTNVCELALRGFALKCKSTFTNIDIGKASTPLHSFFFFKQLWLETTRKLDEL